MGADNELYAVEYAERLGEHIEGTTLVGLENPQYWMMEDCPENNRDALALFLLEEAFCLPGPPGN